MSVLFNPVRGTEAGIAKHAKADGNVYYATDSGKIYLDVGKDRIAMGAAGAAIYYGTAESPTMDEGTEYYTLSSLDIDGTAKVGDLILNSDGGFYKVERVLADSYICTLLSVSGTGGGSVASQTRPEITKLRLDSYSLINGSTSYFDLEAKSAFIGDTPIDETLRIQISLGTKTSVDSTVLKTYWSTTLTYKTYEEGYFEKYGVGAGYVKDRIEFGSKLRDSSTSYLVVQVLAGAHDLPSKTRGEYDPITTSVLELKQISSYEPSNVYSTGGFNLSYNVNGGIDKKIIMTFDGVVIKPTGTGSNTDVSPYTQAVWTPTFAIPAGQYSADEEGNLTVPVPGTATHGHHIVEVKLCQLLNGEEGDFVQPLKYEVCVSETSSDYPPIIWLGDYKSIYYTYDTIQIPFFAYDPANAGEEISVHLYKNNIELDSSPRTIEPSTEWNLWEIVDADFKQQNKYQISCGEDENRQSWREIRFTVLEDESRKDFAIESADCMLSFAATGRTNSESPAKRESWNYKLGDETKNATFTNFNWRNNGWVMDSALNTACLRISNGAKFEVPYQQMIFGSSNVEQQSHSVEMQFKITNAQKYDKLITNLTRYKYKENPTDKEYKYDTDWYNAFNAEDQTEYDNYDSYLQATLDPETYDKLEFHKVEKLINIKNAIGGLYDYDEVNNTVTGFCIGTQDAFFSNGSDTVNVDFVENELTNLSFVYQHGLKNLYIYINGCITGVIQSSKNTFNINSGKFMFNSDHCDIDLYKLRVYKKSLGVNHIVKNFAVDRKDVNTFDMIGLATENTALQEFQIQYNNVKDFIDAHPEKPLMPYIIFDTGDINSRLPYSKKDTKNIIVEFVNVPLEQAYRDGRLEDLASDDGLYNPNTASVEDIEAAVKTYYKHHCPSFITAIQPTDRVKFEVQGTSSEFYPRRNYKVKTKSPGNFNWVNAEDLSEEDIEDLGLSADKVAEDGGAYTEPEALNLFMNRGPFEEDFANDQAAVAENPKNVGYETTRLADGWYLDNYTNATDRWTLKVDYMESSGSYNAGFASWVGNSYTKHPLQDYLPVLGGASELLPIVDTTVHDPDGMRWEDYRTSLKGFPVMAFWKRGTEGKDATYTFIGYYRMLLDKSSTSVLGFKTPKKVVHKLLPKKYNDDGSVQEYQRLRDVAECWEFSNNARGFCSYRDPWNRVELSFKAPKGVANEYNDKDAPVVVNSFEYRYHSKDDYIDTLYDFNQKSQADLNEAAKELGLPSGSILAGSENRETGADALLTVYRNWEKVCKWLWSTNLDAVESQGTYTNIPVGNVEYKNDGTFFIINSAGEYESTLGQEFDRTKVYYIHKVDEDGNFVYETDDENELILDKNGLPIPVYENVDATKKEYLYEPGKFYYQTMGLDTPETNDDVYAICNNEDYDGSILYYEYQDSNSSNYDARFDLLVSPVDTKTSEFNANNDYYTWHGTDYDVNDKTNQVTIKPGSATGAVRKVDAPNKEDWDAGLYYIAAPKTYAGKTYTHDTKEYRIAKFTNEFEEHFDPEYVATYFIMTEVMECYDSRGKNCMMASWGPKDYKKDINGDYILDSEGNKILGEYIWYPIFYDIDTQLGINNTGIPSFTYNVDATEENNFSTSDSILWNNFYRFFKTIWMLPKYQNLRKIKTSKFDDLLERDKTTSKAPLQSVDYIEEWYNFNPKMNHIIACEGVKPLIATNLDLFFKYITITNAKAKEQGVAHLNDAGEYSEPDTGTYFYALQGDRSQSRRQFLTNRLEYIDSWLTQGNYARGGANRLWGRISANNMAGDVHSDHWVEDSNEENSYWINNNEFGTKRNEFDAEYWLELKPIRSSYVTAGDDSANYPSQKYDGINKMYFTLNELENGIRRSVDYPEQLLYIYGTNQMSDFGDLSKMYWTEFKLEGNADRLTRLKLGHDGLDINGNRWYNNKLNGITLPKLPLLKEANFCNINITADKKSLDLSGSEKLENFRATGSNISSITFADGVALNTLYLPSTVASLTLKEANLLTDLITSYSTPIKGADGNLVATKGLYIEGLFDDTGSSQFKNLELDGGSLGYNSYTLVQKLYEKGTAGITLKNVQWCPYRALSEGDVFDLNKSYYYDNGHYGFAEYTPIKAVDKSTETFSLDCDYYTMTNGKYTSVAVTSSNFASQNNLYAFNRKQFNADILSGILYCDEGFGGRNEDGSFSTQITDINESAVTMLSTFVSDSSFTNAANLDNPNISGIIYIHNTSKTYGEDEIVELQASYPNLTFFFANVNKAYSAKFVIFNPDDYSEKYVKWQNGSTSPAVQKIQNYSDSVYFESPFDLYKPEKTHYDFKGWSLNNRNPYDAGGNLLSTVITESNKDAWDNQKLDATKHDYVYYAIFEIHSYELNFYDDTGKVLDEKVLVPYGEWARTPNSIPYKDDSKLNLYETYNFKGYAASVGGEMVDISTIQVTSDEDFYAIFEKVDDVRKIVHPEYFAVMHDNDYDEDNYGLSSGYVQSGVTLQPVVTLKGKITIPRVFDGKPVIGIGGFGVSSGTSSQAITHVFMEYSADGTKAPLCYIAGNGFRGVSTLKYFDFGGANVRAVASYGFAQCALDADLIDLRLAPLQAVQNNAFNQGIASSKPATLFIPSSLKVAGNSSFSNLNKMASGSSIEIGSAEDLSLLDLGLSTTRTGYTKFTQAQSVISTVYFYSDLYDKAEDVVYESNGTEINVEDCFVGTYDTTMKLTVL